MDRTWPAKKGSEDPQAEARQQAARLARRLKARGERWEDLAAKLGISRRALFDWRRHGRARSAPPGRPPGTLDRATRELARDILRTLGPDIGIPTLRGFIPNAPRAPLERFLRHYRLHHRRRRRARLHILTWQQAGAVWAIDLAQPPKPVDGWGRMVLAVRDLASGYSIAWSALPSGSAEEVARAVGPLFRRLGAPLVLKSDNGSCFTAAHFRTLLARYGVVHLRSPRAWPQYNGACEAGIGLLRVLTDSVAAAHGRVDRWTLEDLEEARERANTLPRYRGTSLVPAGREWKRRRRVTAAARRRLRRTIERRLAQLRRRDPKYCRHRARLRRRVIQDAVVALGYLEIRCRWVRARLRGPGKYPSYR